MSIFIVSVVLMKRVAWAENDIFRIWVVESQHAKAANVIEKRVVTSKTIHRRCTCFDRNGRIFGLQSYQL